MTVTIGRRELLAALGGAAAAWPLAARAQQAGKLPTIGVLHPSSLGALAERLGGFRQGLKDIGYVEGENVAIEYRWADNQLDRLPGLAARSINRPKSSRPTRKASSIRSSQALRNSMQARFS
jgi:putative tryptophan/tyrosine transport system substrate-binding protein